MTLEIRTDMYTLPCVKQRASGPLPDSTERSVQWNGNRGGGGAAWEREHTGPRGRE